MLVFILYYFYVLININWSALKGKDIGWRCSWMECWGKYLGIRGRR